MKMKKIRAYLDKFSKEMEVKVVAIAKEVARREAEKITVENMVKKIIKINEDRRKAINEAKDRIIDFINEKLREK